MKKILISFLITMIVCFTLISLILSVNFNTVKTSKASNYYKISVYMNKLAVYKNNSTKPEKVYDVFVNTLPYEDRKALQNGIIVKNEQDLQSIIEDYTS